MKAAVYYGVNDLRVEEVEKPKISENNLLLKVKACGICGSDKRTLRKGTSRVKPPIILGHEVSGEITEVGNEIGHLSEGDRVTVAPGIGCGSCFYCKTGRENLCKNRIELSTDINGGFAEYLKIPDFYIPAVVPFSKNISYSEACLTEPLACCLNGSLRANIKIGDDTVIVGAGPIGLMHLKLAKVQGAGQVIVSDLSSKRLEIAKKLGADIVIDAEEDPIERVNDVTDGRKADNVIIAAGNSKAVDQGLRMVKNGGDCVIFGGCPPDDRIELNPNLIHYSEMNVTGSIDPRNLETFKRALKLIENKAVDVKSLISHTVSLENILEGFDLAEKEVSIKVVVIP